MELAPNTLCLVISGHSAGQSVTAVRPISEAELRAMLPPELRGARLVGSDNYWEVEPAVEWQVLVLGIPSTKISVRAAKRKQLLPIPPKDESKQNTKEEEKPCTV